MKESRRTDDFLIRLVKERGCDELASKQRNLLPLLSKALEDMEKMENIDLTRLEPSTPLIFSTMAKRRKTG